MNPGDSAAVLYRHQLLAQVNITTSPNSVLIDFSNYLSAQDSTAQVIGANIVLNLHPTQPVTVVILRQPVKTSRRLLTGSIVGEVLPPIVREITGRVIRQT